MQAGQQIGPRAIEVSVSADPDEPEEDEDTGAEGGSDILDEEAQAALEELDGAEAIYEKKATSKTEAEAAEREWRIVIVKRSSPSDCTLPGKKVNPEKAEEGKKPSEQGFTELSGGANFASSTGFDLSKSIEPIRKFSKKSAIAISAENLAPAVTKKAVDEARAAFVQVAYDQKEETR